MKHSAASTLVLLFSLSGFVEGQAPQTRKAPDLTFNLAGEGQKNLNQYKGKVVALEFILTTCMHCQAASHLMTKLQNELGGQGLQVIDLAINGLDEGRDDKAAEALVTDFKNKFQVGFPVGWARREEMPTFMGFSVFDRTVVPQLVLIDRQGFIHYQTPARGDENSMLESTIRERVGELLALKPEPTAASKLRHPQKKQS